MPKKNPDRVDELGLKRPDGTIEWHDLHVAEKFGWTTATGRDRVQAGYDKQLAALGIPASNSTLLEFYTRVRYIAFTDPVLIEDTREEEPWELGPPTPAQDAVTQDYVEQGALPAPEPEPEPEHHEDSVAVLQDLLAPKPAEEREVEQDPKTIVLDTHVDTAKADMNAAIEPAPPTIVINNNNISPVAPQPVPIPPARLTPPPAADQ